MTNVSPNAEPAAKFQVASRVERFHAFWLVATPKLFEWFGWVAVLGAMSFVYSKTKTMSLFALVILGYLSLLFYFAAFSPPPVTDTVDSVKAQ